MNRSFLHIFVFILSTIVVFCWSFEKTYLFFLSLLRQTSCSHGPNFDYLFFSLNTNDQVRRHNRIGCMTKMTKFNLCLSLLYSFNDQHDSFSWSRNFFMIKNILHYIKKFCFLIEGKKENWGWTISFSRPSLILVQSGQFWKMKKKLDSIVSIDWQ